MSSRKICYKANESEIPAEFNATFFSTINIIMLLLEKRKSVIHNTESREKGEQT